jgi:hypothetical protein
MTSMTSITSVGEPSYRVVTVDEARAAELVALRKCCYALSKSFEWFDERALEWSADDAASVVLGVLDAGGALVSSVRATIRRDRDAVESMLMYSTRGVPARFPAMIGARSATEPAHARHGLAGVMRRVIVSQARRLGLASITGVVYDDAPRVRSMLAQGYEFYDPPQHWDREARLRARPIIISMPAANYALALAAIESQLGAALGRASIDAAALDSAFDRHALSVDVSVDVSADIDGQAAQADAPFDAGVPAAGRTA